MLPEMNKPIPEGIQREKMNRRTRSIERLDKIIKMGGQVGEVFSFLDVEQKQETVAQRAQALKDEPPTWEKIDLQTRCDPVTYPIYGKLINETCKEQGIPEDYPGAIDWTFRNTKDRVWTVNTILHLLVQRFNAENFILDMKEVIEFLQEQTGEHEKAIEEKDAKIEELQQQIEDMNPEKEVKRRTDQFARQEEVFKQQQDIFKKQSAAYANKEKEMQAELTKFKDRIKKLVKAKADIDRQNRLLQNQKRNAEHEKEKIQKRLKAKVDTYCKKDMVKLAMRQIGDYPMIETPEERRARKAKDPQETPWDFVQEQHDNLLSKFDALVAENEALREGIAKAQAGQVGRPILPGGNRDDEDDSESSHRSIVNHSDNPPADNDAEAGSKPSPQNPPLKDMTSAPERGPIPEVYRARLHAIFSKHVPESLDDIPQLLEAFPGREHYIYTKVCTQFGLTPAPAYTGKPANETTNSDVNIGGLTEENLEASGLGGPSSDRPVGTGENLQNRTSKKQRMDSLRSLPWLAEDLMDEQDLDLNMDVELDRGWSFAENELPKDKLDDQEPSLGPDMRQLGDDILDI